MTWVVLVEPWFGGSHRSWAEGLRSASRHDITIVSLPPGGWRWRLRAGAHPLAEQIASVVADRQSWPDALLVSDLVDVSSLLGLLRLPDEIPVAVYMHESQLVYPTADGTVDGDAVLRNWSSWLAADTVWFNSEHHLRSVVEALPAWAASLPEPVDRALMADVVARFAVMPLGVTPPAGSRKDPRGQTDVPDTPVVVWPHRWEPDKSPEVFLRAIDKAVAAGIDVELVLAGDDPAGSAARADLIQRHGERVLAVGPFDRDTYERWLFRSDVVVSCAAHEFFGVAVVEAMMAGCLPLLPDALSYPEIVPERFHSAALYEAGTFGSSLIDMLGHLGDRRAALVGLDGAMSVHEWAVVAPFYDHGIDELIDGGGVVSSRC